MKRKSKQKRQQAWEKWDLSKVDWEKAVKLFEPDKATILEKLRRKEEEYPRIKEILYLLAMGTVFSAVLIMPGLAPLARSLVENEWKGYQKRRLSQSLKRLKQQKLIEIYQEGEYQVVKITERGRAKALKYKLEEMEIKKPKRWDRKWRLVVFDIPEKVRASRDFFRDKLKSLGFFILQESVFVYPYPCFEEVEFLRQVFNLGQENIRYVVAEKIEGEEELKSHFDL